MKIKSIIFTTNKDEQHRFIESVVTDAFSAVTGNSFPCESSFHDTVEDGMKNIALSLKDSNIIAVFTDERFYHDTKRLLCKALKIEMIHNEAVLDNLSSSGNYEKYMMHALMPKNATPFSLTDGLFPGFAIRSKSQCIFFLPFSQDRTFITMKKFVFPFMAKISGINLPSFNEYETAYAAKILEEKLVLSDAQIALSNTSVCRYIAHAAKKIGCWGDRVSYAPYDKKEVGSAVDKLAAVKAAEYYECRFGACITESRNESDGSYSAVITISNRKTATIRTISSIPDEAHDDFMTTVVTEFFLMLAHEIEDAPELSQEEKKFISPTPTIHAGHIALYIILFATTFFLTYVAASFSGLSIFS